MPIFAKRPLVNFAAEQARQLLHHLSMSDWAASEARLSRH